MQFSNIFLTFLLSTAVAAKGNSTKEVSDKSLCNQMTKLADEVQQASNVTKLEAKTKNNATKIAEIQAKASTAATKLAEMQTNTTLVDTCNVIAAAQKTKSQCENMAELQKTIDLANNATELDAKTKGNETKIAAFKDKAATATTKLAELSSNTTLVDACSSITANQANKKETKASSTSSAAASTSTSAKSSAAVNAKSGGLVAFVTLVSAGVLLL